MYYLSQVYFWIEEGNTEVKKIDCEGLCGGNEGQVLMAKLVPITRVADGEAGPSTD